MELLAKLTPAEKKELKKGIIEVYGKHMNRTALGVVDAIIKLYPDATFDDIKKILPDSINPSAPKNFKSLFKPYTNRPYGVLQSGAIRDEYTKEGLDIGSSHFVGEGETFILKDGTEVLVSKTWESKDTETNEHDLQNLIDHVEKYGVRVVSFEAKDQDFNKGGYFLKIIQPILFKKLTEPSKSKNKLLWLILILLVLAAGAVAVWKSQS